jgi:ABC-2 type transport system ATP-binding protein
MQLPDWKHSARTVMSPNRKILTVQSSQPAKTIVDLVKWIDSQGIELADVQLKRPSLEDVFIELTGKSLRE